MRIQRIPLEQQLRQLKEGIPAHPEFAASAIRSWAETPLGDYFASAGWAGEKLAAILGIPPGEAEGMPYREAAARVFGLWQAQGGGEETEEMEEAAVLLAKPFILYARAWNMNGAGKAGDKGKAGAARRLPLAGRLRRGWAGGSIPAIFGVYLESYFSALSQMCGNLYYEGLYNACLSCLNPPRGCCLLHEAVAAAADQDASDHEGLLRRILAEPFADSAVWEEKERRETDGMAHGNSGNPAGDKRRAPADSGTGRDVPPQGD